MLTFKMLENSIQCTCLLPSFFLLPILLLEVVGLRPKNAIDIKQLKSSTEKKK